MQCLVQEQKQLAVYRRLFMDIEREQVRENLRMKEHRKRMTKYVSWTELAHLMFTLGLFIRDKKGAT